jgi:hypothetical protein
MAVAVTADPAQHGRPDYFNRKRLPIAGGMTVYNIFLVLFDLLRRQDDFGKLTDTGVDSVHDLLLLDLVLKQGAALIDPLSSPGVELDFLVLPGDLDDLLNSQIMTVNYDSHMRSSSKKEIEKDDIGRD